MQADFWPSTVHKAVKYLKLLTLSQSIFQNLSYYNMYSSGFQFDILLNVFKFLMRYASSGIPVLWMQAIMRRITHQFLIVQKSTVADVIVV